MQALLSTLNTALVAVAGIPLYVPVLILIGAMVLFVRLPALSDLLILPYRFLLWIARTLGIFQRAHTWSVVYDSRTKLPLDPAYVTVRNTLGVEVASMITDINGRFSLILPRGVYTIDVQKTHYAFPSFELRKVPTDGKYTNLYYGETINVIDLEQAVTIAVPMDQVGDDWNEQEKKRLHLFSHFGRRAEITGSEYLYLIVGLVLIAAHVWVSRDMWAINIALLYCALLVLNLVLYLIGPTQYAHSVVLDKRTGTPLGFAKVTIYSAATKNKILSKITSFEGQFTAIVPKGTYYLTIEKRNDAGAYSLIHTSGEFHLASGYLGRKFSV